MGAHSHMTQPKTDDQDAAGMHLGIIMDGNGRWAKARGLPRLAGHRAGANTLRDIVRACPKAGVSYLTVYAFSAENWQRPEDEVKGLLQLIQLYITSELAEIHRENVKLRIIGDISKFAKPLQKILTDAVEKTAQNTEFNLTIALNYGGQQDIVQACQKAMADIIKAADASTKETLAETFLADITLEKIGKHLSTVDLPPLDLILRTSGEQRLSNFMLWEAAYTELLFTEKLWPDFTPEDLQSCLENFAGRHRRFGAL